MFSQRTGWKLTPNRFTEAQLELRRAGRELLDLTLSNPTQAGLPYDSKSILAIAFPAGGDGLRPSVQRFGQRTAGGGILLSGAVRGFEIDPESVVLTTSTSEGYSYIFRLLCNPGDEVLVPKPTIPCLSFSPIWRTLLSRPTRYSTIMAGRLIFIRCGRQ